MKIKEDKHHNHIFKVRHSDYCANGKCKQTKLNIHGVLPHGSKYYKILTRCPKCERIYEFYRIHRNRIERPSILFRGYTLWKKYFVR